MALAGFTKMRNIRIGNRTGPQKNERRTGIVDESHIYAYTPFLFFILL